MNKVLILVLLFTVAFLSCGEPNEVKEPIIDELIEAEFRDFSGLDGCTWIIQLPDDSRLEPINLADFDVLPLEGKQILISYIERLDMASICQVGTIIELETLEAK